MAFAFRAVDNFRVFNSRFECLKSELRNHDGLIVPQQMLELTEFLRHFIDLHGLSCPEKMLLADKLPENQDKLEVLFLKIGKMVQDINRNALGTIVDILGGPEQLFQG